MTFTHASYTVAWICALPVELAAAKVFLDEVHPRLTQPKSDHNVYTLGSISGHNVVVACLPAGVYGTTSATAAVSHLTSTYHNIRFGLMVGVGGGVPKANPDIRLGDIVVSKPTDTSSGVIQYDYGKTLQTGRFNRTGSLNKPPSLLLKVIAQIESDSILGKGLLSETMASYLQKEEVRGQFPRPPEDLLFQSTYNHSSNNPTCSTCDPSQRVDRPEREAKEPQIHYGLVASANQVMKDAMARDWIAQELDILCFEMEAAGLMDEIPSLVIRGICDYCDSHKNKEWQPYAAFAAAAYAKAVFMQVPQDKNADIRVSVPEKRHWMVPFYRNLGFVGREEELREVEEWIKIGHSRLAICGLGGVGKTQIAIELAYRIRERAYNYSIFWIPCTSHASVEQAYMAIAQALGMQGIKPAEVKEHIKAYFSQTKTQKWLLVFDNADDMDMWLGGSSVTTALTDFLPQSEHGRILFTTRNRKLAVKLASSSVVSVSEPDAATGVKMLEKTLIRQDLLDDKEETIVLLEQLVFLPLAITQAAAYINSNDIELSDYITLLHEQEPDVIALLSENFEDQGRYQEILNPVATTWLISFRQIQQLSPLAADYLSFMACINPRDIPQSLLPEGPSKKERIDAVGLLKAFSFVSEQAKGYALSVHRLVYLSTRNWLRKQGQFSLHIHKAADHFSQAFPDDDYKNQKTWREYLPHALSLISEKILKPEQKNYIKLIRTVGRCLRADGRYNEAVVLFEDLWNLEKKERSDDGLSALIAMDDLGVTYHEQGRWSEAKELHEQVLQTRRQVLGLKHPETLSSMAHLASTYSQQGRWKDAGEMQEQVLGIRKQVLGPEHPDTLSSMADLASTYSQQGRWKDAEEIQEQVLGISTRVLGSEHPDTLSSMAHLASTYSRQGRWKDAEEIQEQVLGISTRVLGSEHPDTLSSMANLASTYSQQGRWKHAEEIQEQVLVIRKQALGPEHPDTLSSMVRLASTYSWQGRWKHAEEIQEQVLGISTRVLGSEHPDTLSSMVQLASTYRQQGQWKDAEEIQEQVLGISTRVLGSEHPDTLSHMAHLALTYSWQGRWKHAEEIQEQVLGISTRVLGSEHPRTVSSMAHLASTYCHQGQWKDAEKIQKQVLKMQKQVLGPEHPETLSSMAYLASTYSQQGRWKHAEEIQEQVLGISTRVLGSEHPNTLSSMVQLASTYRQQGQWKDAEEIQEQVLGISTRVLGSEHPDTLSSMARLADTLCSQENVHDAVVLMEKCVRLRGRLLGSFHPHTVDSVRSLEEWKERVDLSTDTRQPPVQAESDRPIGGIAQGSCCPGVVITKANVNGELSDHQQGVVRLAASPRVFLRIHPFLLASWGGSPVMREHDLNEID